MENQMLNQAEVGTAIISEMANNPSGREKLISALGKNGVVMDVNTPNDQLYTAIFSGIAYSKAFRGDVKKAIFSYIQEKGSEQAMDSSYSNGNGLPTTFTGQFVQSAQQAGYIKPTTTTTTTTKKPFSQTAVGKFLGNIFTPENVGALANTGINALNQKLTSRADKATIEQGVQLEVQKAETLDKEIQKDEARKKWVVPVIIASSIVVIAIIGYVIYKNKKK
jgi:hypothetical protein